jgi:DNA invertase Pin-like site-specific DNA recombinase
MRKRAVIYLRQSSDYAGSTSIEGQEEECRAECERRGWEVADVIVDNNVSGALAPRKRPGMALVLDMLDAVDVLVIAKLDRLSRVLFDCLQIRKACKAAEVSIVTADGLITETNAGMLFPLLGMVAEWERERIEERTSKGRARIRESGRAAGRPTYGYRIVRRDGAAYFDIDPGPAENVHEISKAIINGMTVADVVYLLNRYGVPSPAAYADKRAGRSQRGTGKWTGTVLTLILRSPALRGMRVRREKGSKRAVEVLRPNGTPDVIAPAIVDASTWYQLQDALDSRAQSHQPAKRDILLTGMIRCQMCGATLAHSARRQRGKEYRVYQAACSHVSSAAHRIEEHVIREFLAAVGTARVRRAVSTGPRNVRAALADVERGIEGLTALAMTDPGNAAELGPRLTELRAQRDTLRAEQDQPRKVSYVDTGETFADMWERASNLERRGMLRSAGVRVILAPRTPGMPARIWDASRVRVEITDPDTVHVALELAAGADEDNNGLTGSGPARLAFAA